MKNMVGRKVKMEDEFLGIYEAQMFKKIDTEENEIYGIHGCQRFEKYEQRETRT